MATPTKAARTVFSSATITAGTPARGTLDLRTTFGGLLTVKMTNGATGPTVQCTCNVLVAHDTGTTPTAAARGSVWKTIATFGNGTVNSFIGEYVVQISKDVLHLEVEFTGNTAQNITAEAFFAETSSIA